MAIGYSTDWRRPGGRRRRPPPLAAGSGGSAVLPFDAVFTADNLLATLDHLRQTGGPAPGIDGLTCADLSRREAAGLCRAVAKAVRAGTYRPQPERPVRIPKRTGGVRTLRLGTVLDRVVARTAADALT